MPYRVEITARATGDLDRIFGAINAENSPASTRWFNGLHQSLRSLSEMPQRSPFIPESRSLRHLLYGNKPHIYRAIYFVDEQHSRVVIIPFAMAPGLRIGGKLCQKTQKTPRREIAMALKRAKEVR